MLKEATVYGILTSAAETVLGEIGGKAAGKLFGKIAGSTAAKSISAQADEAIRMLLKNSSAVNTVTTIVKNMGKEAAEEYFQYALDPLMKNISFDGKDYTGKEMLTNAFSKEAFHSALLGALSSGTSQMTGVAVNSVASKLMGEGGLLSELNLNNLTESEAKEVNDSLTNAYAETLQEQGYDHIDEYRKQAEKTNANKTTANAHALAVGAELAQAIKNMIGQVGEKAAQIGKQSGLTKANRGMVENGEKDSSLDLQQGLKTEGDAAIPTQSIEAETQTQQDSAELLKGEEETGRIKAEEQVESSEAEKARATFFDQINDIGRNEQLTVDERLQKIQEIYEALTDKGDLTVPSNGVFLTKQGFDKNGKPIYDWPGLLGFLKESIQSISKENTLPSRMSRFGSKSGNNLSGIKENGEFPTFDELGLPYADNPSARHQIEFDNELYFEVIDAISEGSLKKLNSLLVSNGRTPYRQYEFDDLQIKYHYFLDNVEANEIQIDATYGLFGIVNEWKDKDTGEVLLKGGADQFTIPLSIQLLIDLGIIQKY